MPAVSITDHGRIASVVPFVQKCAKTDVKPIIGCEVYIATTENLTKKSKGSGDNYHLTLLILNKIGFQNMVELTSRGFTEGFHHRPRITRSMLADHNEGLMLLTGCIGAELPQLISKGDNKGIEKLMEFYEDTFGEERARIEIMYHGAHGGVDHTRLEDDAGKILLEEGDLNDALFGFAERYSFPVVATNDAHYLHERDGEHHDTLICKGIGKFDPKRKFRFPGAAVGSHEFFVKDGNEMREVGKGRWKKRWVDACQATVDVAKMVDGSVIDLTRSIIPEFKIPHDKDFLNWEITGALPE